MQTRFTQIIKTEALARVANAPDGVKAKDVASQIIAAHSDEAGAWAAEKVLAHVTDAVERILRAATELPAQCEQTEFLTEGFRQVFIDNPGLPTVLGIPEPTGEMRYMATISCNVPQLQAAITYREGQIEWLVKSNRALNQYIADREEKGVPPEIGHDVFLAQQQPVEA